MPNLHPGIWVLYVFRSGQVRAGQSECAAMITKLNGDGTANLKIEADGTADPIYQKSVPPRSQEVTGHCWYVPATESADLTSLREELAEAHRRIDALEAKPKRGRPPNAAVNASAGH